MNQCDGCRRGLPISAMGIHHGPGKWDSIGCTAHLYKENKMKSFEEYKKEAWENTIKNSPEPPTFDSIFRMGWEARAQAITDDENEKGEVVVTKDMHGRIVMVSRQDDEGRIIKTIAESEKHEPVYSKSVVYRLATQMGWVPGPEVTLRLAEQALKFLPFQNTPDESLTTWAVEGNELARFILRCRECVKEKKP